MLDLTLAVHERIFRRSIHLRCRRRDAKVTLTYKLDGTESRNVIMSRGVQPSDSVSIAKWDGPRLMIATKEEVGGQVAQSTQVWTVEGSTLTWKPPTSVAHRSGFTRSSC